MYRKKLIRITIILTISSAIIVLFLLFHILQTLFNVQNNYNYLIDSTNFLLNSTRSKMDIMFFGIPLSSGSFLLDIVIIIIIIFVIILAFLTIFWILSDIEKLKKEGTANK